MTFEQKYELALQAYNNSYAKYSHFQVGAVVLLKNGKYILGTNVENASYGLSNCAERTALFSAYANGYRQNDIEEIVIMGKSKDLVYPCGACRQVIIELMNKDALVTMINLDKKTRSVKVEELMPFTFNEEDLYVK